MKRTQKWISLLLALCILLPTPAMAYVGRVGEMMLNQVETVTDTITSDGSSFRVLKTADGTLTFYLALDGPHMAKSVTMSERGYVDPAASIARGVYEESRFTLQTGKSQRKLAVREIVPVGSEILEEEGVVFIAPEDRSFTVRYRFSGYREIDPEVDCYIRYSIVQLGAGATEGEIPENADIFLEENPEDHRTYAVFAQAVWKTGVDNTMRYVFRWFQDYCGFSRMGHSQAERAAHVRISRTNNFSQVAAASSTDITTGLGRTFLYKREGNGNVSEIYSDSYGVDSPFVLADVDKVRRSHDIWPPVCMTYDAIEDRLTAEGYTDIVSTMGAMDSMKALHVWGFRDIYTKAEAKELGDVKFTDPDAVVIPQDANQLGFYRSGADIIAEALTDSARKAVLKKQYGDPLYTLRGEFELKSDGNGRYYEFTDYKVALSSTITAVWMGTDQHFRVRIDDQKRFTGFETTRFVNYSTPRFKLYSPNEHAIEAPELVFEEAEEDETYLTLKLKPEYNDVLVFIDIPEVSSKIDKAQIKPDGDLVLSGMMGLDMILNCSPDKLATLEALGYGPKENADGTISFVQNGIKASGHLDTGSLLGLDLAEIEAAINTFEGEEEYDFSLDLNAFELFKTNAKLNLKRLYNGRLVPNNLYFEFQAEPGIPLIPPVPTTYLKGAGGGFNGLADTINGDYIAIPPIRLRLTAIGDYVKVIEGKVHLTLGPSYFEYAGSDMEIAGLEVLDAFSMYLKLMGEKRKYQGKSYTGLRAGGGVGITLNVPKGDAAIFEVEGNAEATMFGGLDNYKKPKSAYLQLDSRGSIAAKVKIPKKLGKLEFKKLSGYELASTTVDFILGAQTAIPVDPDSYKDQSAKEILETATYAAWNNLSVYGGVSNKGTLFLINYRIHYIIPDKFGGAVDIFWNDMNDWNLEQEIKENAWYVSEKKQSLTPEWEVQEGKCYDAETHEQIGIAVMESSLYELPSDSAVVYQNDDGYREEIRFTAEKNQKVAGSELGLILIPKNNADAEKLRNSLKINADGTEMILKDAEVTESGFTPDSNITEIETEDGKSGFLVAPGSMSDTDHTWIVTADCEFEYRLLASMRPTELALALSGDTANSQILNPRSGKEYAVRYYFDTKEDRTGESYYIDMEELSENQTAVSFPIPADGTLAPTGSYYVTAVLTEKVTGDFNGDGEIGENEYSWVTVDTKTSDSPISFTNTDEPNAPDRVDLEFTGNETLTASWNRVDGTDGYRITLYYRDGQEWKQAGGSYVLENADFSANSKISAASETAEGYSLRMAPTVSGTDQEGGTDAAPADRKYKVTAEAFRNEQTDSDALTMANFRYFSRAAESSEAELLSYTPAELSVNYGDNYQMVILNETNGYGTLTWASLPENLLFAVTGSSTITELAVFGETGEPLSVSGGNGYWKVAMDDTCKKLLQNSGRVKLLAYEGKDVTEYYLRLSLDNIAPILTLDSENIYADVNTGEYAVTGTTEPGLNVILKDEDNGIEYHQRADQTGRFRITGALLEDMIDGLDDENNQVSVSNGFKSILGEVTTQDESGNAADPVSVAISARVPDQSELSEALSITASPSALDGGGTVTLHVEHADGAVSVTCNDASISVSGSGDTYSATLPNKDAAYTFTAKDGKNQASCTVTVTYYSSGSGSSGGGGGGRNSYTVSFETNGGTRISILHVSRNQTVSKPADPVKNGASFGGWFTDPGLTTAYDFSQKVTKSFTLYAKWIEEEKKPEENEWKNPFTDVLETDWYYGDVAYTVQNGLFYGISDTLFAPHNTVTRAMMVTVLYRAEGSPEVDQSGSFFSDIDPNAYYADAVLWAKENGIVMGVTQEEFSPDAGITREELAAILYRYAGYKGMDTSAGADTNILSYEDSQEISEYAITSMQYAVGSGLIQGKTDTTLNPKDQTTRAEMAAILHRFLENAAK